jgi:hypothetical protein
MMWSSKKRPTASAAVMIAWVSRISSALGAVLPDGWLCTTAKRSVPASSTALRTAGSRALRSVAFGVVAVGLAYVAGFVLSGLQNPFALAAVFVLVGAALMYGPARIAQAGRLHPRLSLTAVAVAIALAVLFLSSPTYIVR